MGQPLVQSGCLPSSVPNIQNIPPGSAAIAAGYASIGAAPAIDIKVTDVPASSRKLNVRFTDVSRFNWDTHASHGLGVVETELVRADTLLAYAVRPRLVYPKKRGQLFCAPKLLLDAVTHAFSWEHCTVEQRRIDETEERMTGCIIWGERVLGIDLADDGQDRTTFTSFAMTGFRRSMDAAFGWPTQYLGSFLSAQEPPFMQSPALRVPPAPALEPPYDLFTSSIKPIGIREPKAFFTESAVLRALKSGKKGE